MYIKRIILLYLFVFIIVTVIHPTVSTSYPIPANKEAIVQYIVGISKDIYNSIELPGEAVIYNSRGELRLKLLLSPWGELKNAIVAESSGNKELDKLCLSAAWMNERYEPFPEVLGDEQLWIDVPVIFDADVVARPALSGAEGHTLPVSGSGTVLSTATVVSGIDDAVDIALENHMPADIAEEEVELSALKIREAKRALYPAASLNYMETTGKVSTEIQDFTDTEYKVRFEYPLYYGWRLRYAVDQAIANMNATRHNYDKVLQDLRFDVEAAFYSYLASKVNLRLQESLLKEAEKLFNLAKKRFERELSTPVEFLQVESQLKQITYQVASSENDLALAKLTLYQAMNLDESEGLDKIIDTEIDIMDWEAGDINVTLEECMDLAFRYRPDLKSKGYMVEFNEYGRRIAKSKDQLRVDLTGSYGRSGGVFETEDLKLGDDWFVGFKVTKPLGGNTLSAAYTEDMTSVKHGQTTRTESVSQSVEFGLLDGLQGFSEKKSSDIGLKKAMDDLEQTEEAVFKEVKTAYLNYKKGLIQVKSNLNKIKYREEELKVVKARTELNEVSLSELMQAHISLTDEKIFYVETVGSIYQSLARLNKATGYALFLDSETFRLANLKTTETQKDGDTE